ncbi:thioredoxin family protein [Bacteroidota bacterium]
MHALKLVITAFFLTAVAGTSLAQTQFQKKAIKWVSLEEADSLRRIEHKKVLVDVYTDWCGWCKRMDATTFSDPKVVEYINANYYAVKLNAEQKSPITLGGKTYEFVPNGRRGYHEIANELLQGKMSYPTTVFLDENMNMIQPVAGYLDAPTIQPILEYLAQNAYRETPWEDWLSKRGTN